MSIIDSLTGVRIQHWFIDIPAEVFAIWGRPTTNISNNKIKFNHFRFFDRCFLSQVFGLGQLTLWPQKDDSTFFTHIPLELLFDWSVKIRIISSTKRSYRIEIHLQTTLSQLQLCRDWVNRFLKATSWRHQEVISAKVCRKEYPVLQVLFKNVLRSNTKNPPIFAW